MGSQRFSLITVEDEPNLVALVSAFAERLSEGSRGVGILACSREVPDLDTVVDKIREAVGQALREGFSPVFLIDDGLGTIDARDVIEAVDANYPVVLTSGYGREGMSPKYDERFANGRIKAFLSKPCDIAEFLRVFSEVLGLELAPQVPIDVGPRSPRFETLDEAIQALNDLIIDLEGEATVNGVRSLKCVRLLEGLVQACNKYLILNTGDEHLENRVGIHNAKNLLSEPLNFFSISSLHSQLSVPPPPGVRAALKKVLSVLKRDKQRNTLDRIFNEMKGLSGKKVIFTGIETALGEDVDLNSIDEILLNLFNNVNTNSAITTFELSVQETNDEVILLVNDDGPPLPDDFFNADLEKEEGFTGNGARHMLKIAKNNGWTFEAGTAWGKKFALRIPKDKQA